MIGRGRAKCDGRERVRQGASPERPPWTSSSSAPGSTGANAVHRHHVGVGGLRLRQNGARAPSLSQLRDEERRAPGRPKRRLTGPQPRLPASTKARDRRTGPICSRRGPRRVDGVESPVNMGCRPAWSPCGGGWSRDRRCAPRCARYRRHSLRLISPSRCGAAPSAITKPGGARSLRAQRTRRTCGRRRRAFRD